MKKIKSKYELALNFENYGYFLPAYSLFKECLNESKYDLGDLLFHCAWCIENINTSDKKRSVSYYLLAAKLADDIELRMNAYFRAGWILRHFEDNYEALNAFRKAIEIGHSEGMFNSIYNDALYWFAVTLESDNKFIDAIKIYKVVSSFSDKLNPESRFRELHCQIAIGKYPEAIELCKSFELPPPAGFSGERYSEIKYMVNREKSKLELCCQI
jgi:tetratricopeptide (TPR) repeat protein